ncbi:MAG: BNR-4 repeat-containing protein [Bacteroidota bacterium]|nr:BNR-4 repeat-containing protein [Bacteroidota bacterium]
MKNILQGLIKRDVTHVYFLTLLICATLISCNQNEIIIREFGDWTPKMGGCGGVFFNAQKGPLIIEIEKDDLRDDARSRILRAVFVGPDREVIGDFNSADADNDDKIIRFETDVYRPGIYAVMVTVSNDRYGENITWRFRTNCKKFIIETSRGHKDSHHKEPIVLLDPEKETDLCFLPQRGEFDILITGLPDNQKVIELIDANNQNIASIRVNDGTAVYNIVEGERQATPWRLHFPQAQAKVEIEGVTEWDDHYLSDYFTVYPGGAFWTPSLENWFNFHENRWLLTPYSHTLISQANIPQSAVFTLHNNGTAPRKVKLDLEFPHKKWNVQLSEKETSLGPNQTKSVTLSWKGAKKNQSVLLRATCDGFTTYATLNVKVQQSDTPATLTFPIVLKPYFHEHEQFGYSPDYPTTNQPYFNIHNEPFILSDKSLFSYQSGKWNETDVGELRSSIAAFDSDNNVYLLGRDSNETVLLHSTDNGHTFKSYVIPGSLLLPGSLGVSYDIEQFTGHNMSDGPPPIMKYRRVGADKEHFWRRWGNVELLIPKKTDQGIEWEEPIFISDKCIGVSSHSGLPSSVVSRDDKIFVVWGEVTDVQISKEEIPGVPVFVAMYDKKSKSLSAPVRVGFGPPPNDTHNIPGITIDSHGYLHVLTGTHGRPFQYARSLRPMSIDGGWTEAESLLDKNTPHSTQTYLGLVTDQENTLHTIFRFWQHNVEPFPDTHYATLAYMSKKQGEPWSEPRILVQAPLSHYSNFRHRLTIDREGRLFISYDYWSTYWFYRNDRKYSGRVLLMSSDGGKNWSLTTNDDFQE